MYTIVTRSESNYIKIEIKEAPLKETTPRAIVKHQPWKQAKTSLKLRRIATNWSLFVNKRHYFDFVLIDV